jgi:two-component system sensor histidine kinase ComP
MVTLRLRDDGRGFRVPERLTELTADDHFGLVSVAERVALIGGRLDIDSAPGQGTEITVTVPVPKGARRD